jgi:thiamine-monophosphate kinase
VNISNLYADAFAIKILLMETFLSSHRPNEFEIITRYFTHPCRPGILSVGDDCALLPISAQKSLAISSDMLVEGRHFFPGTHPQHLGHKALAVNLSDLAAMGAQPLAFTLALALPDNEPTWLQAFSTGIMQLANQYACDLIGGDTTRGPLTISITVFGEVAPHTALRRDKARIDDDIWVSGELGDARLALAVLRGATETACTLRPISQAQYPAMMMRLERPEPRVALGSQLQGLAHAAIDISDGLTSDLSHILNRSACGACLWVENLPISETLKQQEHATQLCCALTGGDDYELCFTAPASARTAIASLSQALGLRLTRIGRIEAQLGLRLLDSSGHTLNFNQSGFDHFTADQ